MTSTPLPRLSELKWLFRVGLTLLIVGLAAYYLSRSHHAPDAAQDVFAMTAAIGFGMMQVWSIIRRRQRLGR